MIASRRIEVLDRARLSPAAVGAAEQQTPKTIIVGADQLERAELVLDLVLEDEADDRDRDRADASRNQPSRASSRARAALRSRRPAQEAADDAATGRARK